MGRGSSADDTHWSAKEVRSILAGDAHAEPPNAASKHGAAALIGGRADFQKILFMVEDKEDAAMAMAGMELQESASQLERDFAEASGHKVAASDPANAPPAALPSS